MNKGLGKKIVLRFTEKIVSFTQSGFTIRWEERVYINGPLVEKVYSPSVITQRDDFSIEIVMNDLQRFNNAEGSITVEYDATGGLVGKGGRVLPFIKSFNPVELIKKMNPSQDERVTIAVKAYTNFKKINYVHVNNNEKISVNAKAIVTFINVKDLNP